MSIATLGEKRGEIYRNGGLVINEKYWDMMKASFDEAFDECDDGDEEEIVFEGDC